MALDLPDIKAAKELVDMLGDTVNFYKVGLELFTGGGYFELIDWLVDRQKKVFADLKLHDIPETVGAAVRNLRQRPISFTTVHASKSVVDAACRAKGDLKVLAVTVLTSFDSSDFGDLGREIDVASLVLSRARLSWDAGCDGVIASGLEARQLREHLGQQSLIVVPGIRPEGTRPLDDQKRVATVEDAFNAGADYIVVGRPIRNSPDPYQAAVDIQQRIRKIFA